MATTTDWQVLKAMNGPKHQTSAEIAEKLKITVFQITARLKGMEGRELVLRENGKWTRTQKGWDLAAGPAPAPPPPRVSGPRRGPAPPPGGLPDDSAVPVYAEKIPHIRYLWNNGRRISVYIAKDGEEFVEASAFERADFLYWIAPLNRNMRMRRLETSNKVKRVEKQIEQEQVAKVERRKSKRRKVA